MGSNAPTGINKDEDTSRFHTTKRGNFHEVFNLSENERPLAGIAALVEYVLKSQGQLKAEFFLCVVYK